MEFWSKGLGKSSINLRLEEGQVENCGDTAVITGIMGEPVFWEYRTTLTQDDIFDVIHIIAHPSIVDFLGGSEKRWSLLFAIARRGLKFFFCCGLELLKRMVPWRKRRVSGNT